MEKFTLNDIAGYEDEKQELISIIDMFQHLKEYSARGAYLSKGLILSGEPGVGKTLFAKVLAGEINAPFFYIDGSELRGTSGVRKLKKVFKKARKNSPSIIFIDELNSFVGDCYYENEETKRALSALLKLIDGLDSSAGIFVVGASTDKDDIDEALIRSGRMDKHICLNSPNFNTRKQIFDFYAQKVDLDLNSINKKIIIEKTQGFNGADIKTLINETALQCFHTNQAPTTEIFIQNIQKIIDQDIGRKNVDNKSLVAYHDIGHLIVANTLLGRFDALSIEYSSGILGNSSICNLFSFEDDCDDDDYGEENEENGGAFVETKISILNKITVLLAGSASEMIFQNDIFANQNDISKACGLIANAFTRGIFGFEYVLLGNNICGKFSDEYRSMIERKTIEILNESFERAKKILLENKFKIETLHTLLMKKLSLSVEEIKRNL